MIPVVLVDGWHACKTIRFDKRIDLGDPVNMVSIFNNFEVDELVLLDIGARRHGRTMDAGLLRDIASEARMPFAVGGGIDTLGQIRAVLAAGAEKVVLGSALHLNPCFVREAAATFGSSTLMGCLDVRKRFLGGQAAVFESGKKRVAGAPLQAAEAAQALGVGELILQSVDRDGMMVGYDLPLLAQVAERLTIPVVGLGGAGQLEHMLDAYAQTQVSAFAGGSMFCFKGGGRGVLVNYPSPGALARFREVRRSNGDA